MSKPFIRVTMAVWLALTCLNCAKLNVVREDGALPVDRREMKTHSIVWSFVHTKRPPPPEELCPGGRLESLDIRMDATDVLLSVATLGFYVRKQLLIGCGRSSNFP